MTHAMRLDPNDFERIKKGIKKIEVRLNDEKRKAIEIGYLIEFRNRADLSEILKVKVVGLSRFNSFRELFGVFGRLSFGHPEDFCVEDQIKYMREVYSEKDECKGVLGIHIELV